MALQPASSVRIPQNIGRSLLPNINITPLKLSSVSSIRLYGASNCNTSYGVYISQLIRFARASSHVTDFNNRNKFLTAKLL